MKKASIRDLHTHTGALVEEASKGEVITIEKRGVPVAELRPLKKLTWAEVFAERERNGFFKKMPKNIDFDRYISEGRDR